ncbi:MAG TPA: class I SAM-dependent methyltransferase [Solirubrobacterales bacterium]|nr:class I SAM-dependent methyltransferase [Solirubrobacterales bacterium]
MSAIGTRKDPKSNIRVFDEVTDAYVDLSLMPSEHRLLQLLGERLHEMEMLDLGVGTGRTGYTFAPLVRRYVGLDASPRMLERARALLGDDENVELVEGNARDLTEVTEPFDLVLFSFNGLDALDHEDRLRTLKEVHRVLRPGGYFLFSSHSLGALPLDTHMRRSPQLAGRRLYEIYAKGREVLYARRVRRVNRGLDINAARQRGWTIVPEVGHGFRIDDHYVDPQHQTEQLRELGFEVEALYDEQGRTVTLPYQGPSPWIDYLCRAAD